MPLTVCPSAIVAAPVEIVWEILTQPTHYSAWADAQLQRIEPDAPAVVGQTIHFTTRALTLRWEIVFTVTKVEPAKHQLGLHAIFPLGLQIKPLISCTPLDATTSLLRYG